MSRSEFVGKLTWEISYDGYPDKKCPHCGGTLEIGMVWLDHCATLAITALRLLDLPGFTRDALTDKVSDAFREMTVVGKADHDAGLIADWLVENLGIAWSDPASEVKIDGQQPA